MLGLDHVHFVLDYSCFALVPVTTWGCWLLQHFVLRRSELLPGIFSFLGVYTDRGVAAGQFSRLLFGCVGGNAEVWRVVLLHELTHSDN